MPSALVSLCPLYLKKSYSSFKIRSKPVMILIPIATIAILQNFILWKWVAIEKPWVKQSNLNWKVLGRIIFKSLVKNTCNIYHLSHF